MVQGLCLPVLPPEAVDLRQVVACCGHMGIPLPKACASLLEGSGQVLGSFLVLSLHRLYSLRSRMPGNLWPSGAARI